MTSPAQPRKAHVWLYTATVVLFVTAVAHAVVGTLLGESVVFVNLHIGLTVLTAFAGWRSEHEDKRKRNIRDATERLERSFKE